MSDSHCPPGLETVIERSGLLARAELTPLGDPGYLMEIDRCVSLVASTLDQLAAVELPGGSELTAGSGLWTTPMAIVAEAERRVAEGLVDGSQLSASYERFEPAALVESLSDRCELIGARSTPPVLSNGAPDFENIRVDAGELAGLADWSRAAVADRHRDLALAAKAMIGIGGPALVPALFSRLAVDADPILLDWYLLAVELVD